LFRKTRLRTKFLLSLLAISAGLTAATLFVVSHSVEKRVRESLREELQNSVETYRTFEAQRESTQRSSAQLLANLPNVRALMTTQDAATIQDESANINKISHSDLLVLADRSGTIVGLQTDAKAFTPQIAQIALGTSIHKNQDRDWWFGAGHLYEVWLQPIYFGAPSQESMIGVMAVGHEIDKKAAQQFADIASSEVVFRTGNTVIASTLPPADEQNFATTSDKISPQSDGSQELQLGSERYLMNTVNLSLPGERPVTLSVLKSFDQATAFLSRLNRALIALGFLSVLAGGALVFLISHTFTQPLSTLVAGVRALEEGNYNYPLEIPGGDEVGEVTGAFDRMRISLQNTQSEQQRLEARLRQAHKMEAVGRLAGGVAHDFNNLLTVIRGNSDLLADRDGADLYHKRCVQQIQKASDRAVSMTRQLLAFSRMQVLQPRVLDLNLTISEMSKMLPRLIGEHIEFSFSPDTALASVLADPGQMEQVLLNLAVNARDAMPDGGKLSVRTANIYLDQAEAAQRLPMVTGKYVLLSVSDTGHGMDPETKNHIFEPFFTTKDEGKGTGLGLATVYGVVKQSGGFIFVESSPGAGATFEIFLPACEKAAPNITDEFSGKTIPRGTETILVVEDETAVRELASQFLRSAGYTVLEASDGLQAMAIAGKFSPVIHMLLTDMVMPKMSGAELAEKLIQLRPQLRVIIMSGYSEYSGGPVAQSKPRFARMQKPFSRFSLLEQLREVFAASRESLGEPNGNRLV
jgi:signal transduction histidine kinase/CheY-like chemotaxis protein